MTAQNNIPSVDPSDRGSMTGMLRAVFKKLMQGVHGQLPARVVSYNRATNLAIVQPLIAVLGTDGTSVTRASVASVPVLALGGGGYVLNFPLKQNDLGWIEASDRDISLYMQSLQLSQPNTARLHSFEDGRFIPDAFNKYVIAGEDAAACVLQSLDGTTRIALDAGMIRMTTTLVKVVANMEIDGTLLVKGATTLQDGAAISGAQSTITGGATIDTVDIGGIPFGTHEHFVPAAPGNSNGPIPG